MPDNNNTNSQRGNDGFLVGQRVIFYPTAGDAGGKWFEGRIVARGPASAQEAASSARRRYSYQIQKCEKWSQDMGDGAPTVYQPGETVFIPQEQIRLLPKEQGIYDSYLEATMAPPTFDDPFSHLYMENDAMISEEQEIVAANGQTFSTATMAIPSEEELYGIIEQQEFFRLINQIPNRQKTKPGVNRPRNINFRRILADALPSQNELSSLEQRARGDHMAKMQLADMLNYGFYGVPQNKHRATQLYLCAAWGIAEHDYERCSPYAGGDYSYPMGPPEALCAAAIAFWEDLETCLPRDEHSSSGGVPRFGPMVHWISTQNDPAARGLVHIVIAFLGHAIRRDWVCPFAMALGQVLREHQFLDPFIPDAMNILNALELESTRKSEIHPRTREMLGVPEGADLPVDFLQAVARPSEEQLQHFEPKATEIFRSLPVKTMTASGQYRSQLHVEYREMTFPPFPVVVFSFNPQSSYVYGGKKIPENLMYTPYSQETFRHMWGQIVFDMHMGDKRGGNRYRPSLITFVDKPGDRQFAQYVRDQIGRISGTEIRTVQPENYLVIQGGNRSRRLSDLTTELLSGLASGMKDLMKFNESEMMTASEQANSSFQNRNDAPLEEVLEFVQNLKEEGNVFFGRQRWQPAHKCYTKAIEKVRSSTNTDGQVHRLLGILLSNRAQCIINMAEGMGFESASNALKNAVVDCEVALTSHWKDEVPGPIQTKLKRRKSLAMENLTRISGLRDEFQMLRHPPQENNAANAAAEHGLAAPLPIANQGGGGGGRGGRRRGGRRNETPRQRQNRRRRERQQRRQLEAQVEDEVDEGVDGQEEEIRQEEIPQQSSNQLYLLGKDVLNNSEALYMNGRDDPCPCCFERFRVELAETLVVVNECGHANCIKCTSDIWKKSQSNTGTAIPFTCPTCRVPLPEGTLADAVEPVISKTPGLESRLNELPLSSEERVQAAKELLFHHAFVMGDVLRALDSLLIDSLQASLRRSEHLSAEQKQVIYEEARRPVVALLEECSQLRETRKSIIDQESEEYVELQKQIDDLEQLKIPAAQENAKAYVFERINSAGDMGTENDRGDIAVDFHALHVNEAKNLFDEQVLPILPAVKSVLIVVGRGRHSDGGVARVKPALENYIARHGMKRHLKCSVDPENSGMLRVEWIES